MILTSSSETYFESLTCFLPTFVPFSPHSSHLRAEVSNMNNGRMHEQAGSACMLYKVAVIRRQAQSVSDGRG